MFILEIDKVETGSNIRHVSTSWLISLTPGFENDNIVFKSIKDSHNLLSIRVPLPLNDDDMYYSKTKVHFSDGTESDWSKPTVITRHATGFNFNDTVVVTPKLSLDYDVRNAPLGGFLIKGSKFELFSGIGKHKYTNWIIDNDKGEQIWSRLYDNVNLTSIRIPHGILLPGRLYTIKAMYITDTNAYSNYGKLTIITNPDLVKDPVYLNNLGITDLKAFETNTALRGMVYDITDFNKIMEKLVKANIYIGLLKNRLEKCKCQ